MLPMEALATQRFNNKTMQQVLERDISIIKNKSTLTHPIILSFPKYNNITINRKK